MKFLISNKLYVLKHTFVKIFKMIRLIICLLCFYSSIGQSIQDYKEFLKEKIEANPPLDNYEYLIAFSPENVLPNDAEIYAGRKLNIAEYNSMMFIETNIYSSSKKDQRYAGWVNAFDLRGIRKISTSEVYKNQKRFYLIHIYTKSEFINSGFLHIPNKPVESKTDFTITYSCSKEMVENIKKAFIKIAELSGAENVIDGDKLFED